MENTIYNTHVKLKSTKQFKRLIEACSMQNLIVKEHRIKNEHYFWFSGIPNRFSSWLLPGDTTEISEKEFIELLKTTK